MRVDGQCASRISSKFARAGKLILTKIAISRIVIRARRSLPGCHASKTAFRSHCARPAGRYIRGVLSEFRAARTCASYWFDNLHGYLRLCCEATKPGRVAPIGGKRREEGNVERRET